MYINALLDNKTCSSIEDLVVVKLLLVVLVELVVKVLYPPSVSNVSKPHLTILDSSHTLGRLTFGMITEWSADGASFVLLVSPPGWYWYFPEVPEFHGSEPGAIETACSDEAEVGLRAITWPCQKVARVRLFDIREMIVPNWKPAMPNAPDMMKRRICPGELV